MPGFAEVAFEFGYDQGRKRGLIEALRMHLSRRFGPAGRRLANELHFLDDVKSVRDFTDSCWDMRSFKKVRACLDQAFQKERSAIRKSS
jgi:hypothetical protein